jgi:hypothetical protein
MGHEGVAQNRDQWQAIVNSVITSSPLNDMGNLLAKLLLSRHVYARRDLLLSDSYLSIHCPGFYLKQRFGDWILSPPSGVSGDRDWLYVLGSTE